MNEEVSDKTVRLAVTTTKVTVRMLIRGLIAWKRNHDRKKDVNRMAKDTTPHGKQSVKELVGQGQGVSSMEIGDSGIRDFKKIANKYGVDFAIVKDKEVDPPKYTVFFKARDADAMTAAFNAYSAEILAKNKRPSVLKTLHKLIDAVRDIPAKVVSRDKQREQSR